MEEDTVDDDIERTASKDEQQAAARSRKRKRKPRKWRKSKELKSEETAVVKLQPILKLDKLCDGIKEGERMQLKLSHVQDLLLYTVLHSKHHKPKWVGLPYWSSVHKAMLILLSAVDEQLYKDNKECFPKISKHFKVLVPTKAAGSETMVQFPHETLLTLSLQSKSGKRKSGHWRNNTNKHKEVKGKLPGRKHYVLTADEMSANGFPLPDDKEKPLEGYVCIQNSSVKRKSIKKSPMFAIDCEMCNTSAGKELTRVSVVDESLDVLYDTYVKPDREIIDYLTRYSGITARTLRKVTTRLSDVQEKLRTILPPGAILLGHSLDNDLKALKLHHDRVIDTSVTYGRGIYCKPALRQLASRFLGKVIQQNDGGHCSIEDARTCMQLAQLKIKKGPEFGNSTTEELFDELDRKGVQASILDRPSIVKHHCSSGSHTIPCASDEEVVSKIEQQMNISHFTWAHLHGAEYAMKEKYSMKKPLKTADESIKEVLRTLDSHVDDIVSRAPSDCAVLVVFGCADLTAVKNLQKQGPSYRDELIEAVKQAKNGLCFIKRT